MSKFAPLDNQIAMLKDKQVAGSKTVNTLNQQQVEKINYKSL
ncbi:hypothetical protein O9992_18295 [Vibrio lentus]|nr:hypothetical protein [Vibrio lentus]